MDTNVLKGKIVPHKNEQTDRTDTVEHGGSGSAGTAAAAHSPPTAAPASLVGEPETAKKKHRWARRIGLGVLSVFLGTCMAGAGVFLYLYNTLSVPAADGLAYGQATTVSYAQDTTTGINREIVDTTTLPDYVSEAIIASEDRTFYTNPGIDIKGMARALVNNLSGGDRQGGSTITQQYVERYYMGQTTSYVGKVKEAVLAIKVTDEQSKEEIIGGYMNTIYFGRGTYGIEDGAEAYFGHSASELTLSEAALLAAVIPAPSAWDPAVDADTAQERWERVLDLMVEDGWVTQAQRDAAVFPQTIDPDSSSTKRENQQRLDGGSDRTSAGSRKA